MEQTLDQPLVAILINPDERTRENILAGRKSISIRLGHCDYRPGCPVMLCCHLVPWAVMAYITEVRHCTLNDVTEEECLADGFECKLAMFKGLKEFYPNMTWESLVTVVKWANVRGQLMDDYKLSCSNLPL